MGQPDLFRLPRKPRNAGRMIGAKAPLKPKHIWAIRQHLKSVGAVRDLAMFNIALDAKLRGCDLVRLPATGRSPGLGDRHGGRGGGGQRADPLLGLGRAAGW